MLKRSPFHSFNSPVITVLTVLLLCLTHGFAQEIAPMQTTEQSPPNPLGLAQTPQQTFLHLGALLGLATQQDAVHSPLRYTGAVVGFTGELRAYSREIFVQVATEAGFGLLTPNVGRERNLGAGISAIQTNTLSAVGFELLHREDHLTRLFAGPMLNVLLNIKVNTTFGNSATAFDFYASLGAMARLEQDFTLFSKQWRGTSQVMLPLGGIAARPYYSTSLKVAASNSNTFANFDTQGASILTFPQILWRTSLDYTLSTGNWLSLTYAWDFYDYNRFNRVQAARQALTLSLQVRLQ